MGVYINMEMPTSCGSCLFRRLWPEDDEVECIIEKTLWTKDAEKNPACPLVPIPPHGDLIDRNSLKEQLEYVASLEWNQRVGASPGIECAIDMLDDAQTIIPASEEG